MLDIKKVKGWEQRLFRYTASMLKEPFSWGVNDCALFAAGCIEAQTGVDPAEGYRGTYDTPLGAARIIAQAGCASLGEFVASMLPEAPVSMAGRGDLIISDGPEGEFIAVCQGVSSVGPTPRGLIHIKTLQGKRAFKV